MELVLLGLLVPLLLLFVSVSAFMLLAGCVYGSCIRRLTTIVDSRSARRSKSCAQSSLRGCCGAFWLLRYLYRYQRIDTELRDRSTTPTLYAHQPHGMLALSAILTYGDAGGARLAAHSIIFDIPILRELALWAAGAFELDVEAIGYVLAHGESVAILPGGVREQVRGGVAKTSFLDWNYKAWRVPVVPVVCSAEHDVCWVWRPAILAGLRDWAMQQPWLRYPLGTLFWPKPWWMVPPLVVKYGKAIDPMEYATFDEFKRAYDESVASMAEK